MEGAGVVALLFLQQATFGGLAHSGDAMSSEGEGILHVAAPGDRLDLINPERKRGTVTFNPVFVATQDPYVPSLGKNSDEGLGGSGLG